MTSIDLTNKRALVIGGGVGIGSEIANELAACGADVALTSLSHNASETVEAIRKLGRRASALRLDATDSAAVARVTADAAEYLGGGIDILVNNAGGLVGRSTVAELDDDLLRRVFEVNVFSAFFCARAILPYMTGGWDVLSTMARWPAIMAEGLARRRIARRRAQFTFSRAGWRKK